ncbi:hypothetical protein [Solwaraspora sp. WMMA2101]
MTPPLTVQPGGQEMVQLVRLVPVSCQETDTRMLLIVTGLVPLQV